MDGGHETLLNAKLVVDHLGQGGKAVGGARGIATHNIMGMSECGSVGTNTPRVHWNIGMCKCVHIYKEHYYK